MHTKEDKVSEKEEEIQNQSCFSQFKNKQFLKGLSTVLGACIVNFLIGEIFSLMTLVVYEISYIKQIDNYISIDHLTFYYPIEIFFQCFFSFASGYIYKKLGLHATNLIGTITLILGHYIMFLSSSLFYDIISIILAGSGIGIIYYPSTTNACEWFSDHNGLIIGILETMISLGSFYFSYIGEYIINKEKIQSHFNDNLYDFEIGKKMKIYLKFLIIFSACVYVISYILMFDIKNTGNDDDSIKTESDTDLIELEDRSEQTNNTDPKNDQHVELIVKSFDKNNEKINYKKMLFISGKSKRLITFIIISILHFPVPTIMFSLYRGIGEYKKIDMNYLQLIGSVNFIFECLSSFIFGILCDYVNLKYLLFFINGVDTLIAFTYCFTFENSFLFFLAINCTSFISGGYYSFQDCYLMKVFGTFIYIELTSYVSFLMTLMISLMSPIVYYIETRLEVKDNAYWILFISLGVLNLIGTILGIFIDDSKFDYRKAINKRK